MTSSTIFVFRILLRILKAHQSREAARRFLAPRARWAAPRRGRGSFWKWFRGVKNYHEKQFWFEIHYSQSCDAKLSKRLNIALLCQNFVYRSKKLQKYWFLLIFLENFPVLNFISPRYRAATPRRAACRAAPRLAAALICQFTLLWCHRDPGLPEKVNSAFSV